MIDDEDNLFLLLMYGGSTINHVPQGRPVFANTSTTRSWRTTPYYGTYDRRPTKAEAKERIEKFRERRDRIVRTYEIIPKEIIDLEPVRRAIPWWVVAPFYVAPYVAEGLIELDPLDRLQE